MQSACLTRIRYHFYTSGLTGIHVLAAAMDVLLATLRCDLQRLEDQGDITRTQGGAAIAESGRTELAFSVRQSHGLLVKRTIANEAHTMPRPSSAGFYGRRNDGPATSQASARDDCPADKFGRNATCRLAPLRDILRIVTDEALSGPWRDRLQQMDVPVSPATAGSAGIDDPDA